MCALRIFIILQFRTSLYWAMMGQVKLQPRLTDDKPYSVWLVWPTCVICFIISRTMCTWMRWALAWDSVASSWRSRLTEKIPISRFANNVLGAQHVWGPRALRPAGPTVPDHARAHSIVAGAERIPCRPRLQVGLWGLDHSFLPSSFDPELFPLLLRWLSFFRHSWQMLFVSLEAFILFRQETIGWWPYPIIWQ